MGIRGLTSFFNLNPDFSKSYKLHNSLVIVDGDNLIHTLYFNKVSSIFGGDYNKYANRVRKYFSIFLDCKINPIVIFDGGYDKSGRKLKTILERAKSRLKQVNNIYSRKSNYERILPILARHVFYSVLVELDIIFAICDYEADDQITVLANYYNCPVISADSDFYVFNIHNGFIRLDSIDTDIIERDTDSNGTEYKYLSCSMYYIDEFICCFPGIDKSVLPLFGTLMGNDYIKEEEFENFFSSIQMPKYDGRKLIFNNYRQKQMVGLLCWLKNTTLEKAIENVMLYLKLNKREFVKSVIKNAVNDYELSNSNLSYIIDKKLYNLGQELFFTSRIITPCGNPLPLHFIAKLHSGKFDSASYYINAIVLHKLFLLPQIEDMSVASSYECACFIRRVTYGIIIRHVIDNIECQNEACLAHIEETERCGSSLKKRLVQPIFSLDGIGMLPNIDELNNLKEEKYMLILTRVLGVNAEYFLNVPSEWQLLIACINYCLRHCKPHCTEPFIYALVINLIYHSIIKNNNSTVPFKCSNKKPMEFQCTCSSITCISSRISDSELEKPKERLKQYVHLPSINNAKPLLIDIVHNYSQLQSCIIAIESLNKLLGEYMINPAPHKCFSGTMLYNLATDISSRRDSKLFVGELLGRVTNLHVLFSALISKIYLNVPSKCIAKPIQRQKRKLTRTLDSDRKNNKPASKSFNILGIEML